MVPRGVAWDRTIRRSRYRAGGLSSRPSPVVGLATSGGTLPCASQFGQTPRGPPGACRPARATRMQLGEDLARARFCAPRRQLRPVIDHRPAPRTRQAPGQQLPGQVVIGRPIPVPGYSGAMPCNRIRRTRDRAVHLVPRPSSVAVSPHGSRRGWGPARPLGVSCGVTWSGPASPVHPASRRAAQVTSETASTNPALVLRELVGSGSRDPRGTRVGPWDPRMTRSYGPRPAAPPERGSDRSDEGGGEPVSEHIGRCVSERAEPTTHGWAIPAPRP